MLPLSPKPETVATITCWHCDATNTYEIKYIVKCAICKNDVCPFCVGLGKPCPKWTGDKR